MKCKGLVSGAVSAGVLILIWAAASRIMAAPFILPSPVGVAKDFLTLAASPEFLKTVLATCWRGLLAFTISFSLACILGIGAGLFPFFASALRPWMSIIKATPVVSIILIALLWFGSSFVPIFVSVLMTLPVMTESITAGVKNSDVKLLEMAKVYGMKKRLVLQSIRIPSAMPYLLSGAGTSLGLTWKVVVAGEIIGYPHFGIGTSIQSAKIQMESARVFSLTITAIALSILTELLFDFLVHASKRHIEEMAKK